VVAGRLFARLGLEPGELPGNERIWADTRVQVPDLAGSELTDVLSGRVHKVDAHGLLVSELYRDFPGAVLVYSRQRVATAA
jgi:hypothetical protein